MAGQLFAVGFLFNVIAAVYGLRLYRHGLSQARRDRAVRAAVTLLVADGIAGFASAAVGLPRGTAWAGGYAVTALVWCCLLRWYVGVGTEPSSGSEVG